MVKLCVICGNMDGDNDVSMHRIPTDVRRLQWVEFVVNQSFPVNLSSKLCSRHFIPGHDYIEGEAQRRRLRHTAIPSLIKRVYLHLSTANIVGQRRRVRSENHTVSPQRGMPPQINSTVLRRVTGAVRTYYAIDTVMIDDADEAANYQTEFLNALHPNGLPPHELTLKVGSIVMLLRNIDPKRQLCNGTRLVVTELRRHNFKARRLSGADDAQEDIILPAVSITSGEEDDLPFRMKRIQFPVRLSFAMTINKSRGQTFDRVGLLLPSPAFSHGQLYVAFSRVRDAQSVKVGMYCDGNGRFVTKNIVYAEVL
ncbi:uncharacterized protein LOC132945778 [Metopolophium dirhodum]|uniref:uncharacterized protein LOC132945778 n=1 Tax=Metopolophium dirhodum TaxID=44670 RepID=UPI00299012D1|nr:uncharacterized protein LOC132945778 [Metopolophium dirhodum]